MLHKEGNSNKGKLGLLAAGVAIAAVVGTYHLTQSTTEIEHSDLVSSRIIELADTDWSYIPGYDLNGFDIRCFSRKPLHTCAEQCAGEDACKGFIYNTSNMLCCLKNTDAYDS